MTSIEFNPEGNSWCSSVWRGWEGLGEIGAAGNLGCECFPATLPPSSPSMASVCHWGSLCPGGSAPCSWAIWRHISPPTTLTKWWCLMVLYCLMLTGQSPGGEWGSSQTLKLKKPCEHNPARCVVKWRKIAASRCFICITESCEIWSFLEKSIVR